MIAMDAVKEWWGGNKTRAWRALVTLAFIGVGSFSFWLGNEVHCQGVEQAEARAERSALNSNLADAKAVIRADVQGIGKKLDALMMYLITEDAKKLKENMSENHRTDTP